jgi:hypothetical protein
MMTASIVIVADTPTFLNEIEMRKSKEHLWVLFFIQSYEPMWTARTLGLIRTSIHARNDIALNVRPVQSIHVTSQSSWKNMQ